MRIFRVRSGFLLLDALLGAALFAIFIVAVGVTILAGQISFLRSGDLSRGVYLSQQGLEAMRSLRNADWDQLSAGGPYGYQVGPSGTWELSGTGVTTADGFDTFVTVALETDNAYRVTATSQWELSKSRKGAVTLETLVTNWRAEQTIGDWSTLTEVGSYTDGGTPLFEKILVSGDYVFVTSDKTSGGAGLYVFDVSDPANPQRVAETFVLPGHGHQMSIIGDKLVVIAEQTGGEILLYDISSPETLSSADLVSSIDVPGDGRARAMDYYNGYLFVGATESASSYAEVYSYQVETDDSLTLLDSFEVEGTLYDLELKDGYAYFASGENVAELRVVDVFDPADLQNAPGNGYNLTDVEDALTIDGFGTGIILGRVAGDAIEELILFDIADSAVPSPPPGPYYMEISGAVRDIEVEPGGRYAFMASEFTGKELQIVDPRLLATGQPAEVSYYDAVDVGRGVAYDLGKDQLYFITSKSLHILQPN